jgi:hypothetical protein
MRLPLALLLTLVAAPLCAETLVVGDAVELAPVSVEVPKHGASMTTVEARFGAPRARHAAVGAPPITRWDYDSFSVYFENQLVIHAVAHAAAPAPAAEPAPAPSG